MGAAYDTYDYPSYWEGRVYEHQSEILAIKYFLNKIPKFDSLLEVGCGYGRLTPSYLFRTKKAILSDPSATLLKLARKAYRNNKKVTFLQSGIQSLPNSLKAHSQDVIVMVRVLHHIEDIDTALATITNLLKVRGYLILEFANKRHLKATLKELFKGNFTFPLDIFTKDLRSQKSMEKRNIAFLNYHPDMVNHKLESHSLEVKDKLSVSNIRSTLLKKLLTTETLLVIEKYLQKTFGIFSFGPSIFILAQKKG